MNPIDACDKVVEELLKLIPKGDILKYVVILILAFDIGLSVINLAFYTAKICVLRSIFVRELSNRDIK